ncbi:hypothetical protein BDR07DRAFT_1298351 [Suillus spraguei]|nr:hypothetical protein BDR07DRAFT_1298351 [Suillus spraguei]
MSTISQSNITIPFPPLGTNYLVTLVISIPLLLTGTVLLLILTPILIAVHVFLTPETCHHLIFALNGFGLLLGLTQGAVNIYLEVHTMLSLTVAESRGAFISYPALAFFGPFVVESTLVICLAAVYPWRVTPKVKYWIILLIPITFKLIQAINVAVFLHNSVVAPNGRNTIVAAGYSWGNWQTKFKWIMQAVDNGSVKPCIYIRVHHD